MIPHTEVLRERGRNIEKNSEEILKKKIGMSIKRS